MKRCNKADLKLLEERGRVNVYLRFPELKENCSTCLVLTDVKTDSVVRRVYVPETVARALLEHRKNDYGLVLAQDNGRRRRHGSLIMVTEQYSGSRGLDRKRTAGLIEEAYFGRKHAPQTTSDEEAAPAMLRENPEVLKLFLA